MKLSPKGVASVLVLVLPCVYCTVMSTTWMLWLAVGLSCLLGPAMPRPIVKLFHAYHNFMETMFLSLTLIAMQLVGGTRTAITAASPAGQREMEGRFKHHSHRGPNLDTLLTAPRPGKVKVIIMNHHCRVDWLYLYLLAYRSSALSSNLRVVLKDSLKKVPMFGIPMQCFAYLFLSRSWATDEPYIRQMVDRLKWLESSTVLQIYPEGTDLSPSSIEKSQAFAEARDLPKFHYVLNPRTTGLVAIKEMFGEGRIESVVNVTLGYTYGKGKRPAELSLLTEDAPSKIHFLVQEHPMGGDSAWSVPCESEAFANWIHQQFALKEQLLSRFYNTSPVGFVASDVQEVLGGETGVLTYDQDEEMRSGASLLSLHFQDVGVMKGAILPFLFFVLIPYASYCLECRILFFLPRVGLFVWLLNVLSLYLMHRFQTRNNLQEILFQLDKPASEKTE